MGESVRTIGLLNLAIPTLRPASLAPWAANDLVRLPRVPEEHVPWGLSSNMPSQGQACRLELQPVASASWDYVLGEDAWWAPLQESPPPRRVAALGLGQPLKYCSENSTSKSCRYLSFNLVIFEKSRCAGAGKSAIRWQRKKNNWGVGWQ